MNDSEWPVNAQLVLDIPPGCRIEELSGARRLPTVAGNNWSLPMEPFDFPDSDPGPHTLRSGIERDANGQRLEWALSRFTGYAGVTNLLGQRFLTDSAFPKQIDRDQGGQDRAGPVTPS